MKIQADFSYLSGGHKHGKKTHKQTQMIESNIFLVIMHRNGRGEKKMTKKKTVTEVNGISCKIDANTHRAPNDEKTFSSQAMPKVNAKINTISKHNVKIRIRIRIVNIFFSFDNFGLYKHILMD